MSPMTSPAPSGITVLDHPVQASEKSEYVQAMFDKIAPRYDLLNTVLSAGIHHSWRKFATRCAALQPGDHVLDVCTGTGDWATLARKAVGPGGVVVGVDFSLPMMVSGNAKFRANAIDRSQADAARLPFQDGLFDAVTIGFGIRNVAEVDRALSEMTRVLKPGGRLVCLEFAEPRGGPIRSLYGAYSRQVLPRLGNLVSGSAEAYTYLPESVARFRTREDLRLAMGDAGLAEVRYVDLTFGIVCVHVGVKPARDIVAGGEGDGA